MNIKEEEKKKFRANKRTLKIFGLCIKKYFFLSDQRWSALLLLTIWEHINVCFFSATCKKKKLRTIYVANVTNHYSVCSRDVFVLTTWISEIKPVCIGKIVSRLLLCVNDLFAYSFRLWSMFFFPSSLFFLSLVQYSLNLAGIWCRCFFVV